MRIAPIVFVTVTLAAPAVSAQALDRDEAAAMVSWVNEARAARHLAPLAHDPRLDGLAETHSVDMARSGYFSHQSPTTGTVEDRATSATVRWRALGENIAFNQSPRMAHEALLRSPGHYANITGAYRSVGIGVARTGDGVYVTQVFATLLDAPAAARLPQSAPPAARPATPPTSAPPADDTNDVVVPPIFQGWTLPWTALPGWGGAAPGASPRARNTPNASRSGVRNCEVDTPFGHVSISIAGGGIDLSGLPCNPDASRRPAAHPTARAPRAPPAARAPARRTVPRIEVPPVPRVDDPVPSNEPLGAPASI